MECLLSYVEFAQYRDAVYLELIDRKLLSDQDIKDLAKLPFNLPSTVPKSSIVYGRPFDKDDSNEDFKKKIKRKAFILFNKYIKIGSEYEINIAYRLRREMTLSMGNLDEFLEKDISELELLMIFDECCAEMITLVQDAFRRFTTTTQFFKLSDLIFVKSEFELININYRIN